MSLILAYADIVTRMYVAERSHLLMHGVQQ